jgi:hypothetical protein
MASDKKPPGRSGNTPAPFETSDAPQQRVARTSSTSSASSATEVADFVHRVKSLPTQAVANRGRLIFAMDATMSRQPTWDMALALQADMFEAVKSIGGLDVQLMYFRGAGECRASKWVSDTDTLAGLMTAVECRGGYTQIRKVLAHARREAEKHRINAVIYIGDCMEENPDDLCGRAGELALHGVPMFVFQEGRDERAERTFRELARIAKGAWCRFDAGSAEQLRELLAAVAVYAAGGGQALAQLKGPGARLLLAEMKRV